MSTHAVRRCGLSTAQLARLDHACRIIDAAFGEPPYLVGSANDRNDFRDVDVRLILADAEFDAMFGGREQFWGLFCLAVTYYLAEVSGLPVDFQVQRRTEANEKHKGMRNPLGLLHKVRFAGGGDATMFAAMSDAVTGAPTDYAALVAEAEAAEEGVTEGPWKVAGGADAWAVDVEPSNRTGVFVAGDLEIEADARFIVASRALVPRLRQAVVDLVEENERLRSLLRRAREDMNGWAAARDNERALRFAGRRREDTSAADENEASLEDLPTNPDDFLTADDRRELQFQLESIARKRREAESEAQNLRIG